VGIAHPKGGERSEAVIAKRLWGNPLFLTRRGPVRLIPVETPIE
jgi:hypothetical protein